MKVLIVEDEILAVERLRLLLLEFDKNIEVIGSIDSVSEAVKWFSTHAHPDLVFLDIELADGTSFSIFSEVAFNCPVIFTTAYDNYAIDAFRLFSIDYLLKPITVPQLAGAMKKLDDVISYSRKKVDVSEVVESLRLVGKNYKQRFLVKSGVRMFCVECNEISYFSADDKTVFLIDRKGNRYIVDLTLEKLLEVLDPRLFFRLNRNTICSISAIREIKTYFNNRLKIMLQAGHQNDEIVVSRERVSAFKTWADL